MSITKPVNAVHVTQQLNKKLEEIKEILAQGAANEPQSNIEMPNITMDALAYACINAPLNKLATEHLQQVPAGMHWQASCGTVFQPGTRDGRFVSFDREVLNHTRIVHLGEVKGSISLKAARDLGYVVEGK